jgi:hypothetical protein
MLALIAIAVAVVGNTGRLRRESIAKARDVQSSESSFEICMQARPSKHIRMDGHASVSVCKAFAAQPLCDDTMVAVYQVAKYAASRSKLCSHSPGLFGGERAVACDPAQKLVTIAATV